MQDYSSIIDMHFDMLQQVPHQPCTHTTHPITSSLHFLPSAAFAIHVTVTAAQSVESFARDCEKAAA